MLRKIALLTTLLVFTFSGWSQTKTKIIVDADTGNEVDDLYALVRILLEPTVEVTALNAAHWQTSHWSIDNAMENSHRLESTIAWQK